MSSILQRAEEKSYRISNDEARELIRVCRDSAKVSESANNSYFRLLQLRASAYDDLERAHKELYQIVKEECITPEMNATERNRATNFARSAVSVLRSYVKAGFPLDPDKTKSECWEQIKGAKVPLTPEQQITRQGDNLLRLIKQHKESEYDTIVDVLNRLNQEI